MITGGIGFSTGMTQNAELSPTDWVREQTEKILENGTTEGVTVMDRPIILVTTTGAKSGKQRYVPVMRVAERALKSLPFGKNLACVAVKR